MINKQITEDAYQKGDFQAAKRQYSTISQNFDDPFVYLRIAQCHFALKEYSDAEIICQTALELNPNFADLHILLGKVFYQQNHLLKAEEEAMKAIKLDENLAGAYTVFLVLDLCKRTIVNLLLMQRLQSG